MHRQLIQCLMCLMTGALGLMVGCASPMPPTSHPQTLNDQGAASVAIDAVQRQSPMAGKLQLVGIVRTDGTYQVLLCGRANGSTDRQHVVLIRDDGRALVLPAEGSF